MKKIILTCVAYIITLSVYAQTDSLNNRMNSNDSKSNSDNNLNDKMNHHSDQETVITPKTKSSNADQYNNSIREDSMHTVKPVQPGKASAPVMSDPSSRSAPGTVPNEKSTVKTPKDKTMYLVPDSAVKSKPEKK